MLVNLWPPRLVLVREPDLLRVERADQPLAFGARLVELCEEDRHVAADDDWTPARLDDDYLRASCVAWRRDETEPRQQLEHALAALDRLREILPPPSATSPVTSRGE